MIWTTQTSRRPSSSLACGAIFIPPPYVGALAKAATMMRLPGAESKSSPLTLEILVARGTNFNNAGSKLKAYPPCARSHCGSRLARRAISASRPMPATQQKRCSFGAGASPVQVPPASEVIKPKSILRTLLPSEENLRQAAKESRTLRSFNARAKSFPLPEGTTKTGSCSFTNCGKWRCTVPSPPKMRIASVSLDSAGRPIIQCDSELAWNGRRFWGEHPGPKMAAARTSAGDYQNLTEKDTNQGIFTNNKSASR